VYLGPFRLTARQVGVTRQFSVLTGRRNLCGLDNSLVPYGCSQQIYLQYLLPGFPVPADPCQYSVGQSCLVLTVMLYRKAYLLSGIGPSFLSRLVIVFPARLNRTIPLARVFCLLQQTAFVGLTAAVQLIRCDYQGCTNPPSGVKGNPLTCVPEALIGLRLTTPCLATHLCMSIYSSSPPQYRNPPQPSDLNYLMVVNHHFISGRIQYVSAICFWQTTSTSNVS
jgi:hypothetical protein